MPTTFELQEEIAIADKIIAERNRLLAAVQPCPAHGDQCVPHAIEEVQRLYRVIEEVHSWIVCVAIASPEDMMQNAGRIEEITRKPSQ